MKICTVCKEEKATEEFPKRAASKDGLSSRCKPCNYLAHKKWAQRYPERNRAHSAKEQAKLKERNPQYWNDWGKKRYHEDEGYRGKMIAKVQARRVNAALNFTAEEFAELCLAYGGICLDCKRDDVTLTVDHVVPVSRGGSNDISNIQPLCKGCNSKKGVGDTDFRPF